MLPAGKMNNILSPATNNNNSTTGLARQVEAISLAHPGIHVHPAAVHPAFPANNNSSNGSHDACETERGVLMERVLHVSITNSLSNLALAGPNGGCWTLVDGSQNKTLGQAIDGVDVGAATSQLRSALVHEVTILDQHSNFPVSLGVHLNCVPAREFTELGDAYAYTVLPNSKLSTPETIYKAQPLSEEMYEWHKQFPQYNAANLETEGIMHVNNHPSVFIDCQHPVVSILRANAHLIGCDIDSQKKMGDNYFKISRQVLKTCSDTIRQKVLNRITTHDLNTLGLQINRLNANGWEDLGDGSQAMAGFKLKAGLSQEEEDEAKRKHLSRFVSTPYTYTARIKIKYEVPRLA